MNLAPWQKLRIRSPSTANLMSHKVHHQSFDPSRRSKSAGGTPSRFLKVPSEGQGLDEVSSPQGRVHAAKLLLDVLLRNAPCSRTSTSSISGWSCCVSWLSPANSTRNRSVQNTGIHSGVFSEQCVTIVHVKRGFKILILHGSFVICTFRYLVEKGAGLLKP